MKGTIVIHRELCKGCERCIVACPKKLIQISKELNRTGYFPACYLEEHINEPGERKCTGCTLCAVTCPDLAIEVYRD